MKRRSFGQLGISTCAALAIGTAQPGGWLQTLAGELATQDQSSSVTDRILVVIQLSGGNDGLNTIVPYRDELYAKARPKLGIPSNDVIKLTEELGLHPSLRAIENQFSENRFSIIQGVGYPSPNRSHFESMDIWHSCHPKKDRSQSGWLGRWITEQTAHPTSDSTAIHIGSDTLPLACQERGVQVPSLASLEQMRLKAKLDSMQDKQSRPGAEPNSKDSGSLLDFLSTSTVSALEVSERLDKILAQPDASGDFPKTALGEKLRAVSRLILSGLKTRIYYVTLDGFDTHANQPDVHASLLKQWSEALAAFLSRLKQTGQHDRVLVMTFSEFGRRVSENASLGTDHGAAAPMFLAGPKLPKIIHGPMPDLSDLEDGDLRFKIDFRSVYASVLEHWMMTDSRKALDGDYHDQVEQLRLFS
ncbi:MAG: DUF1501 domain-containing protein [Planctomycetaceae bacterium]|jgi:uncharacterized protein (DUF1501 family)|nr:DUF1501 domain-containing protein [Planctomycetaceae bacterium]